MIKLEHTVLPSPKQMQFVIEGMRNPMNSWDNSDSYVTYNINSDEIFALGNNDHDLMQRLAKAGTDHRKYMRMMTVYVRITAPLYWWKEFDTYKVGTVANSCSTMHKIQEKEFTLDDFSFEHILDDSAWLADDGNLIGELLLIILNGAREDFLETKDKKYWWQMIQLLPSSYNQTRNVMLNYEVLSNMYHSRKNHKLDEWREFCKWIEELPYSELIIDSEKLETVKG
jgi:hypothetical protein|nr:MAG TPA: hypothetical protein [Caudoviricetes sp.]